MVTVSTDDGISFTVEAQTSDGLRFRLVGTPTGERYIQFWEKDIARIAAEFGSSDLDFTWPLIRRICKLGIKGKIWTPDVIKSVISFIRGIRPRDQLNALLGFQMMTLHETIMINYGRIKNARFMENLDEEEDAQHAVNRLLRSLIRVIERFDQRQYRARGRFAASNDHPRAKTPKGPERTADLESEIVEKHRTSINDSREADAVRSELIDDGARTGATDQIKTSDGLKFRIVRTSHEAHLILDEQDAAGVFEKYGSSNSDFIILLICRTAQLGIKGRDVDSDSTKLALSFLRGIRSRDDIGALLGFHMAFVNEVNNSSFHRVNQAQFMQYNADQEYADYCVSRSARTFVALEEAMDRHQNADKQKFMVRHMTATNGRGLGKTARRPRRRFENVDKIKNGAVTRIQRRRDKILMSKN